MRKVGDLVDIETIYLDKEFMTLQQLLKYINVIGSGGQAKWFLKDHAVLLNGEFENRRGKKLYPGDTIELVDIGIYLIREEMTNKSQEV
ncbi:S4 domain-containing protein YaaA [Atopobacter phocae]|uniref:S4 domain-containing protein YaaA n=1 Tax=Atopobacter phocae TaxID=136492 RepID=UPI0004B39AF6|nr:S4 domain-containing protein YaaA [Atopobacter phocae]